MTRFDERIIKVIQKPKRANGRAWIAIGTETPSLKRCFGFIFSYGCEGSWEKERGIDMDLAKFWVLIRFG